ncbi:MAG: UDP-N-acetylmuramoyl-L-alanine--D-glutamate ligase [Gemmatimonadaceae bacterium]|nr:UDP-N-acetylmuramoyl-L-alanine--D-glutamate ligase [Gemmatimonadaceae bacterium]
MSEVAVLGLGRSGRAAALLLARAGQQVYASDATSNDAVAATVAALRTAGVDAVAGTHDLERIARAARVVVSPGIPPEAPPLQAARRAGVPIVSEVEIALQHARGLRYIATTGTNGKTTVTALIAHLLRALGTDAVAAGNIGTPLAEVALADPLPAWVALELSSFQLHDTPSVDPVVGVLTNLAPDHLDRYASLAEYYADKRLLFRAARPASRWVTNADDADSIALTAGIVGERAAFSLRTSAYAHLDQATGMLVVDGAPVLARGEVPLLGDHNVANVLAALAAVMLADPAHRTTEARGRLAEGVRRFGGIPHRLEVVGERAGVRYINDSKATNVASARVAIAGMTQPTVVLLGGRHKGEPYTALLDGLRAHARAVVAFGEAEGAIVRDLAPLAGAVPVEGAGSSFETVMARARALAHTGDAVLLAPACSSFDMFANYEARGAAFRRLALEA